MIKNKAFFLLLCLPLLVGCAAQQERAAKKSIERTCTNLMGCSEEEVALELGAPQSIQNIGTLKVYQYHKSYGTRTSKDGYVTKWDSGGLSGFGTERSWEAYDKIEVFFMDDRAISWKCSVKR
ncbi:MAG: hypothetical protein WCW33_02760 [Candidatus Babeliales bacterium]|jgi:hypothetical protein